MPRESKLYRKEELLGVLRRLRVPEETLSAIDRELPDLIHPVELERVLGGYGLTLDTVSSWMGGSP